MYRLLPLLDPLGSGLIGLFALAWLEALGLAALSIAATCLFVFTGARPMRPYYVVSIVCFGLSQAVLLGHSFEWWRGAMLELPVKFHPMTVALPGLSVMALFLITRAPSLRKERDDPERRR
jgi:hypothetical protein